MVQIKTNCDIWCAKCGNELDAEFVDDYINVDPCSECIESQVNDRDDEIRQEAYDEGYAEGKRSAEESRRCHVKFKRVEQEQEPEPTIFHD